MGKAPPLEELTRYGIEPKDEGLHPYDPEVEWWNESWFWDWFDPSGVLAGHCRIGLHPSQRRAWLWFYLYRDGEWIALEEPRLPLSELQLPRLAYRGWGLEFAYDPVEPLAQGTLRVSGFGRVVSGPRTGTIQPLGAELTFTALGAAHSTGRSSVAGHSSESFDACRFEQPVAWEGKLHFGEESLTFAGRGERDHSWGPRAWNMDWTFVVGNGRDFRFQCTEARIPGAGNFGGGYVAGPTGQGTRSIAKVEFDFVLHETPLLDPISGSFHFEDEKGETVRARLEVVSAAEIDITHTFVPPQRSFYRRSLVRIHLEDGGEPLLGWCEVNQRKGSDASAES